MLEWLSAQIHDWGYLALFAMTFLETSAFLGLVAPGESVVVIAGLLASRGVLGIGPVIGIAALGALLGDNTGYLIGRRFGEGFVLHYGRHFFIKKEYLDDTRRFVERFGGKTMFFGRFVGWLRAFAPVVAGTAKMHYGRFLFFDVYGTFLWAATYSLLGYIAGNSWDLIHHYLGEVAVAAGAAALLAVAAVAYVRRRRHLVRRHLGWLDRKLGQGLPAIWGFTKDRFRAQSWYGLRLTVWLVLLLLALLALAGIVEDLVDKETLYYLDTRVQGFIEAMVTPQATALMVEVANGAGPYATAALAAAEILYLVYARRPWKLFSLAVALGLGAAFFIVLRALLDQLTGIGPGFPSAQAFAAMLVFGFLAYLAWTLWEGEILRFLAYSLAVFATLLIGFSQVYLHAHWMTDVLAGYAAGLAWLAVSVMAGNALRERYRQSAPESR